MNKSVLIKRKFLIAPGCKQLQIKNILSVLEVTSGIKNVSYEDNENVISVEYDPIKIGYSKIESILNDQKIDRANSVRQKLLSIWYDYLDTTARDNALAPPAACCNKPPRRH